MIEELLEGPEVSLFALCDGRRAVALGSARDYKRAVRRRPGAEHRRHGSLFAGAVARRGTTPRSSSRSTSRWSASFARRGSPFVGCLFAGLMLTADGPRVLEFNARFGDPETQALIPRLEGDLRGPRRSPAGPPRGLTARKPTRAVTVVLTGPDYPARSDYAGAPISGVGAAEAGGGALVFHGGTAVREGELVTNGGRILSVTALGPTIERARMGAYAAIDNVRFEGMQFRTDIGVVPGE